MSDIVTVFPLIALVAVLAFMFGKSNQKQVVDQDAMVVDFQKKLQSLFPDLGFSFHKSQFFDCTNIAVIKTSTGRPIVVVGDASYIKGMKSDPLQRILLREYSVQFDEYWLITICEFIEKNFERENFDND
jgi:hypothetical protein